FFDPAHYFDLVESLGRLGVDKPVIAGIMPATSLGSIKRMAEMQGSEYAKPRSAASEEIDGVSLPVYRGDLVNQFAPTPAGRAPDPERMLQAYFHAAATLNYVRALIE